jgi:hypothetical protein
MENIRNLSSRNTLNVLLIGNNPMDMGKIIDKLNRVRNNKVVTEIAFDFKSIVERLLHFKPNYILIDDNIGMQELNLTVEALCSNRKTKDVPIAILKNSNYDIGFVSSCVLDYVLKQNWSPESLFIGLKNTIKYRKTQHYN